MHASMTVDVKRVPIDRNENISLNISDTYIHLRILIYILKGSFNLTPQIDLTQDTQYIYLARSLTKYIISNGFIAAYFWCPTTHRR